MPSIVIDAVTYQLPIDDSVASKVPLYNAAIIALSDESTELQIAIGARAFHSTTQSLPNNTNTAINLDSERWDTDTIHDNATNNTRLTCKTAGKYVIVAQLGFASNPTGVRGVSIRLNGTTFLTHTYISANATDITRIVATTIEALAVNDYVEMIGLQVSGGSLNTEQTARITPEFSMARLGA